VRVPLNGSQECKDVVSPNLGEVHVQKHNIQVPAVGIFIEIAQKRDRLLPVPDRVQGAFDIVLLEGVPDECDIGGIILGNKKLKNL